MFEKNAHGLINFKLNDRSDHQSLMKSSYCGQIGLVMRQPLLHSKFKRHEKQYYIYVYYAGGFLLTVIPSSPYNNDRVYVSLSTRPAIQRFFRFQGMKFCNVFDSKKKFYFAMLRDSKTRNYATMLFCIRDKNFQNYKSVPHFHPFPSYHVSNNMELSETI